MLSTPAAAAPAEAVADVLAAATSATASTSEAPAVGFDSIKKWAASVEGEPTASDGDVEMADASAAPGGEVTTETPETLHERTTGGQGAGAGDVVAEGA